LTGWVVHAWSQPVYYGYGAGGNVYYEDNAVYIDGTETCSAEEYYEQANTIAASVPEVSEEQADAVEWLPLGVFALAKEGVSETNLMLQLAVSKEGIVAGTFFNETTESSRPVEGTVDSKTQRAAWTFADGKNTDIVMETGIYDLTENEASMLVHFGPDKTQSWVLVRLDEPDADATEPEEVSGG
jgi:hypothetical protein